jgi:hypothetical protein
MVDAKGGGMLETSDNDQKQMSDRWTGYEKSGKGGKES